MFKEIENELASIISDEPIEKIAHMPTNDVIKTMDLIYKIKQDEIERVYSENMGKINRLVVIYKTEADDKKAIGQDLCLISGKLYHITLYPSHLLSKDENNAITFSRSIIKYISQRISLIIDDNEGMLSKIKNNTLDSIILQSIPVITCAVMRRVYSGPSLAKVIYMSLSELIPSYKKISSEEGINSILNLLDEGIGVTELIDNGFICAFAQTDPKYPGIWGPVEEDVEITLTPANNEEE